MAEERTLGLVRAHDQPSEDLSKEELQRRLDEARGSISNTVTEIKESVVNQVQAVKDTLDWREQFKKRPIAWTAGAAGVGFLLGYGVAAVIKGNRTGEELLFSSGESPVRSYSGQALVGQTTAQEGAKPRAGGNGHDENKGPGLFHRLAETPAYEKVKNEAGSIGDALLHELGNTAKLVVIPALIRSVKGFLGNHLGTERETSAHPSSSMKQAGSESKAGYQPVLEHNQS